LIEVPRELILEPAGITHISSPLPTQKRRKTTNNKRKKTKGNNKTNRHKKRKTIGKSK
jgi:hypothetical protein